MTAPLYISNSGGTVPNSLIATTTCDTRALLQSFGFRSEEERLAADCGTAAHACLACWFRGGSVDDAMAVFEAAWGPQAEAIDPEGKYGRLTLDNTAMILREWFSRNQLASVVKIHPELVEVSFSYPLVPECVVCGRLPVPESQCLCYTPTVIFCGTIDAIVTRLSDGALIVVDHKTSGNLARELSKHKLSAQISGYVWAAQQATSQPILGGLINGIEFKKLPGSSRKCTAHKVTFEECRALHANMQMATVERPEHIIDSWLFTARREAKKLKGLLERFPTPEHISGAEQQGFFNEGCMWCDYSDFCFAGRPVAYVETMLTKRVVEEDT